MPVSADPLKVLILEDRLTDAELMLYELRKEGYQPDFQRIDSEDEFLDCLDEPWDIILSDYTMPQFNASRALGLLRERGYPTPFIVVTGDIGEEVAVQMIKQGATDYLLKDRLTRLGPAVTNALQEFATTLKKQETEEKLRKSERKYRDLVENLNEVVYSIDQNRIISYIASPIESLSGFTPQELIGHDFQQFLHPEDRDRVKQAFQQVRQGKLHPEVFRVITKSGENRWVRASSRLVNDHQDSISIQGVMTDIHDEIITKKELEESEGRYRTIFENTGTAMLIIEQDQRISMVNENAIQLTGYPREEIEENLLWTDLITSEEREQVRNIQSGAVSLPNSCPFSLITKDRQIIPGLISVQVIQETKQSVISVIDISSQVELQDQLKINEKKYQSIFEGVQDAVFVENDQGQILEINQRACEMFGYERKDFLKKNVADIVAPESVILKKDMLKAHGGSVENVETQNIRANGEIFPVELSAQIQTIDNQELMIIVLRDISSRKAKDQAMQRQLKELTALHSIANTGTREIDEEGIIQNATEVIGDVLNPNYYGIMIYKPEHDHLVYSSSVQNLPPNCSREPIPLPQGITGRVAASGSPMNIPDVSKYPDYIGDDPEVKSELCVPIQSNDQLLGVINIESVDRAAFDENDQRLLMTLAGQLATAIERARLFHTVGQQVKRLQTLRTIDRAISSSLDLGVTLNIILDQTTSQLGVDAANILLLESHTQSLNVQATKGFQPNSLVFSSVQVGAGYAGKVALANEPVFVTNLMEAGRNFRDPAVIETEGFVIYYALPLTFKGKTQGVLELFHRSEKNLTKEWRGFASTLANQAAIAIDNAEMFEDLQRINLELTRSYDTSLKGWARALEMRDHETEGHSQRVVELTLKLAKRIGVQDEQLASIRRGTLLHDIGKIAIPDSILLKPGELTEEEWKIIKRHPLYARRMLEPISYLKEAMSIPLYHHEWWNGEGYPEGLQSTEIPLAARIFAVIDVWDALINDRPYRNAWPRKKARTYIQNQAGIQFDPEVVKAFLEVLEEEAKILQEKEATPG